MTEMHKPDDASFPYCSTSSIYSANNHNKPADQMTVCNTCTSPRTKSELYPEFTSEKQQTEVSEVRHLRSSSCTVMASTCALWLVVCVQNIRLKKRRLQRVSRILGTKTTKLHTIITRTSASTGSACTSASTGSACLSVRLSQNRNWLAFSHCVL